MNERIRLLALQAGIKITPMIVDGIEYEYEDVDMDGSEDLAKFAKLIVEDVLDEVKERAYYTGDRDWSDEVDRPWIQLEFGYGKLAEMKK